jgi:hypothetical protein
MKHQEENQLLNVMVQKQCLLVTVKIERDLQSKQTINIQLKIACYNTTGMCFSEISLGRYYLDSPENIIRCQEMIPASNTVDAHM